MLVVLVGLHLERLLADEVALVAGQHLGELPAFFRRTIATVGVTTFLGWPLDSEHDLLRNSF